MEKERLTKSQMDSKDKKEAFALATEALRLTRKIALLKEKLEEPEAELSAIKTKLARELADLDMTSLVIETAKLEGVVTLVNSKTAAKLDEQAVAERLGLPDLKEFKVPGNPYTFVKVTPKKVIA